MPAAASLLIGVMVGLLVAQTLSGRREVSSSSETIALIGSACRYLARGLQSTILGAFESCQPGAAPARVHAFARTAATSLPDPRHPDRLVRPWPRALAHAVAIRGNAPGQRRLRIGGKSTSAMSADIDRASVLNGAGASRRLPSQEPSQDTAGSCALARSADPGRCRAVSAGAAPTGRSHPTQHRAGAQARREAAARERERPGPSLLFRNVRMPNSDRADAGSNLYNSFGQ